MKKAFKHIPESLQNAVIGFGGSLPGVGKSYTKDHWAEKLKSLGYQVIVTGSTHKASGLAKTIYSVAGWTDFEQIRKQKKFVRKTKDLKVYTQRSAFIMIDEAWMLSQEDIETVRKQFPKCCILIFGDPNQFPPISDNTILEKYDEMGKDAYDPYIYQIRKAIKKGLKRNSIYSLDKIFNLTVQYRVKTPQLKLFLDNIKAGFASEIDALTFLQSHQYREDDTYDFAICRTWEGKSGVYSYRPYKVDSNKKRVFSDLKHGFRGVYVGQHSGYTHRGFSKNSLFDLNGKSFENDSQITDMSIFRDEKLMQLQGAVTCHAIQGTTLNKGTKVVVDVDDAMSLIDVDNFEKELYEDFARFLYVACSRVQSEDDITFKCNDIEKFLKITGKHVALGNDLGGTETNSEELCCCDDPTEFLLSFKELKERKPQAEFKPDKRLSVQYWLSVTFPSYDINNTYNSLTWKSLKGKEKCKVLHISEATYYPYKSIIEQAAELYFKQQEESMKQQDNSITTGKTLGEIVKEAEAKAKKEDFIQNFEHSDLYKQYADTVTREWWEEKSKEERIKAFDCLLGFLKSEYLQQMILVKKMDADEAKKLWTELVNKNVY